jgi:hypothetical protein
MKFDTRKRAVDANGRKINGFSIRMACAPYVVTVIPNRVTGSSTQHFLSTIAYCHKLATLHGASRLLLLGRSTTVTVTVRSTVTMASTTVLV